MSALDEETMKFGKKQDLMTTKKREALVEISLGMIRLQLEKVEKAITTKKHLVIVLEEMRLREKLVGDEFRKENEQKSLEVSAVFRGAKTELLLLKGEAEKLKSRIADMNAQIHTRADVLSEYKGYERLLKDLMSLEQEIGEEAHTIPDPPSRRSDSLATNGDASDYPKPEEYYHDSWKLLNVMTVLKEYCLSLIESISREEDTLIYQRDDTDNMSHKLKVAQDKEVTKVNEVKSITKKVREETANVRKKIEVHESLLNTEEDLLLQSLERMVCELYQTYVNKRPTAINSLKKLSAVECHLTSLLRDIDAIDEERLLKLRKEQWNVRKYMLQQENVKREWEKTQERLRKCVERALSERKVVSGRKLMARSAVAKQEVAVSTSDVKQLTPEELIWEELMAKKCGKNIQISWRDWLGALELARREKMRAVPPAFPEAAADRDRLLTPFGGKPQPPTGLPLDFRLPRMRPSSRRALGKSGRR